MGNIFNQDFIDFLSALYKHEVEYVLVGGYSVILHGYPRTTGDLDIWVKKNENNYKKIVKTFDLFGLPVFDMTRENFLHKENFDVFTFGRPPVCIDIMTALKGLDFDDAYKKAIIDRVDEVFVKFINFNDLILAKKASARSKDINDIENLEEIKNKKDS